MRDEEIIKILNALDIQELIRVQRATGRAKLDVDFKKFWAEKHAQAKDILDDEVRGEEVRRISHLLKAITYSLDVLGSDPKPTYYSYSDVHILDWYLGRDREKFAYFQRKSVEGISVLLSDLVQFEGSSVVGTEVNHRERYDEVVVLKRIQTLKEVVTVFLDLLSSITGHRTPPNHDPVHYRTIEDYAAEPSHLSALLHFSCMPQTQFHDEVVFLRTIHISEFCFFGIRMALTEAIENIGHDMPQGAARCLGQAVEYAKLLHRSFKVLRTMPPEHFADFRSATGNASAVQSRNYQLMEVYFRGPNPQKQDVYARIHTLTDLNRFAHPLFVHLGKALDTKSEEDSRWCEVFQKARALDRDLLTWRGLHLSFAKLYLDQQQDGTGATEGAAYLQKYLRAGLFKETAVDVGIVSEMFADRPEIPDMFRVPTGATIAPEEERRKPN
jgi:tryptophan 2,3-dioxygenase